MSYLEITLFIEASKRAEAAAVYAKYKEPFLQTIRGASSKALLVRDDDVQVLHGFDNAENARAYLQSDLFNNDVVVALKPLFSKDPDIRIYEVASH